MKILWFSNSPCGSVRINNTSVKSGGWLISLEDEVKKLNGIQLEVAFFSDKKEEPFEFKGVKYYPINRNILSSKFCINRIIERYISQSKKDNMVIPLMLKVIELSQPDIIHIHGTEEAFGLITNYIKDIPIVFSIQGLIAPYKEKYFSGIPKKYAYKLDSIKDRVTGIGISRHYKSFCYRAEREKEYLRKAKYIFGRTFWDKNCTLALNPNRKYYTVNEILRPEFYNKCWKGSISTDKIKIVSIVSGGIYKGFETVLKTALLLKNYSDIDFEWHIAGYTSKTKWVKICEKYTGIYSKDSNIIFHGRIDAEKLSNLLCDSDMYVHVSHIENSPNSVCEAMILGLPIIASYAGGTASLLQNEKDGILYQDGDPYVLAGAIKTMASDTIKAVNMGIASKSSALNRHNPSHITTELINSYNNIILDFKLKGL